MLPIRLLLLLSAGLAAADTVQHVEERKGLSTPPFLPTDETTQFSDTTDCFSEEQVIQKQSKEVPSPTAETHEASSPSWAAPPPSSTYQTLTEDATTINSGYEVTTIQDLKDPLDHISNSSFRNISNEKMNLDELINVHDDESTIQNEFLSFEEWKRAKGVENQQKQSNDHQMANRQKVKPVTDAIGEEMEIDLSNFFNSDPEEPEGKLYKDKFNFASFDCAATIVKTNSEAKGATSILFENKDSYLLNPCSAPNQFVVIELCQDILVDSIVMGNFEFFSSTFKKVRFSVSETFPVTKTGWKVLAEVTAKDVRDVQSFSISNPMIWAKYLRVEVLEHYGNEYYCPLSVVRVHGRTMMQEYKQEEALQLSEEEIAVPSDVTQDLKEKRAEHEAVRCPAQEVECNETSTKQPNDTLNAIVDLDTQLESNLTAWNDFEECAVTLPQLTFTQLFKEFHSNDSCDTSSSIPATNTPSPPNQGGTQESIYKNIMKRLSSLEANATLSVLYIEEQSRHISNAFTSLEKRHSKKLEGLMTTFNATIHSQIEGLSELYDLVQRRTDEMFNQQREQHERRLHDSDVRIEVLANDLKFQRMMNFINVIVLFCLLFYVVLTRDTYIDTEDWQGSADDLSRARVVSRGSRLRANLVKRYYYNSDGGSTKSPSDDDDSGHETPLSAESTAQKPLDRPPTPDNSDTES